MVSTRRSKRKASESSPPPTKAEETPESSGRPGRRKIKVHSGQPKQTEAPKVTEAPAAAENVEAEAPEPIKTPTTRGRKRGKQASPKSAEIPPEAEIVGEVSTNPPEGNESKTEPKSPERKKRRVVFVEEPGEIAEEPVSEPIRQPETEKQPVLEPEVTEIPDSSPKIPKKVKEEPEKISPDPKIDRKSPESEVLPEIVAEKVREKPKTVKIAESEAKRAEVVEKSLKTGKSRRFSGDELKIPEKTAIAFPKSPEKSPLTVEKTPETAKSPEKVAAAVVARADELISPAVEEKKPELLHPKKEENAAAFYYDDDSAPVNAPQRVKQVQSRSCPYLDTINRNLLDFDFEKLCSVSLSHMNVYACLVCGKYFQGRGTNTHAYTHSVDIDHRVFLNLQTLRFYCLPDNYEIIDSSLDDIKYQLNPIFTKEQVDQIDGVTKLSRAMHGDEPYRPGVVGLNNIKANDYCNVVLHALSHVPPLRDYFLREENYRHIKRAPGDKLVTLYQRYGELNRKLWNPKAFKSHVSPHEMLQAVVLCSKKQFQITEQGDAIDFLSWLLNSLHMSLNGTKKTTSSIIYKTFRGRMRVFSRKVPPVDTTEESMQRLLLTDEFKESDEEIPFLYLSLDPPPAPLYRDEMHENIIPQVPLGTLLQKFNGTTEKEYKTYKENFMKRFELIKLPNFLIFYIKRFTKNAWYIEKNPTIVNFPIKNVDLFDCLSEDARLEHKYTTYDCVANIVHDGKPDSGKGTYRTQLLHRGTDKWFELEDLHVKEILPQMITLAESYLQIWELNRTKTREERRGEVEIIPEGMETE